MKKAKVFLQDIPPYEQNLLVCSGVTKSKQVMDFVTNKEVKQWVKDNGQKFADILNDKKQGYAINHDNFLILIIKPYKNHWDWYETLLHELNHIVFWITEAKSLQGEMEAQAYLQEWLFREIRRKLRT